MMHTKKNALIPYLTFNGNCREAMTFYQQCIGGNLTFQTIGESPMAGKMPEEMGKFILHATLSMNELQLLASDMVSEQGLERGNSISLMLECISEEEIKKMYDTLSEGGTRTHPLELTFWGALFGDLRDKYGNLWILHFHR